MILLKGHCPAFSRQERRQKEREFVQSMLDKYFAESVQIERNESGQPYLPAYPDLHISISHTEGFVAVALSDEPIGLDIEMLAERVPKIAPRILSRETDGQIRQSPNEEQSMLYHLAWTGAEALYKLVPQSELISDFEYWGDSLQEVAGVYYCKAYYKPNPEQVLYIQACLQGAYMLSCASYEIIKEIKIVTLY